MRFGNLSSLYPDPIASGIFHAYVDSPPLTQMTVLCFIQEMKRQEIADTLCITPKGVNRLFSEFKMNVIERSKNDGDNTQ